jgi:hypothetical protein
METKKAQMETKKAQMETKKAQMETKKALFTRFFKPLFGFIVLYLFFFKDFFREFKNGQKKCPNFKNENKCSNLKNDETIIFFSVSWLFEKF